jgi:hypothetical protein
LSLTGKKEFPPSIRRVAMKRKMMLAILLAILAVLGTAAAFADSQCKVDICHIPPGNPDNAHTINVSVNAIPAHLEHGDTLGECGSGGPVGE